MLSPEKIFSEIKNNDAAFQLFVSTASKGETQGGWENERISHLTKDPLFAARILKHGADESKHGRLFEALLKKRKLPTIEVPLETDYCILLEKRGIGIPHDRLLKDEPLNNLEHLKYIVHSRVTEQRAFEEICFQQKVFKKDTEIKKAVDIIANDEINHLSYCHEELQRFQNMGYENEIREMLKQYALVELRTYKDVSVNFVDRIASFLNWNVFKKSLMKMGIYFVYAYERFWGWRRMVTITEPARKNALGSSSQPISAAA